MIRTLTIIYASSTGHTEFVIDTLLQTFIGRKDLHIVKQRAESSTPEDLRKSDLLLLACGSWNTGGPEGQMNPWMHTLLEHAKDIDLNGMLAAAIGLGDERYFFTARAADLLTDFLTSHHARLLLPTLKIINDPYDQTKKILGWTEEFLKKLDEKPTKISQKKL
jgi:flavodoxin